MRSFCWFLLLFLGGVLPLHAQWSSDVCYSRSDSLKVVRWLEEGRALSVPADRMVFFTKKFLGLPYVGGTLDGNREEKLVVNLREMDCTTLVESVVALTLTAASESTSFHDFCQALERVRYTKGIRSGYASRNHYFSEWIRSNQDLGLLQDVFEEKAGEQGTALKSLELRLDYMSRNASRYPMLQNQDEACRQIAAKEKAISGQNVWYLPKESLRPEMPELEWMKEGDIVAFVTRRKGLDIAHLGIVCRVNGQWRFWHASSLRKKVLLEPLPLIDYVRKQPMQTGIRILRIL